MSLVRVGLGFDGFSDAVLELGLRGGTVSCYLQKSAKPRARLHSLMSLMHDAVYLSVRADRGIELADVGMEPFVLEAMMIAGAGDVAFE